MVVWELLLFMRKYGEWLVIFVAIAMTIVLLADRLYVGPAIGWDESVQLGTVYSYISGHNFSLATAYNPENLSEITYDYLIFWPPTYAWMNSFSYRLMGDVAWAALTVELAFTALFGALMYGVLRALRSYLSVWVRVAILLFWMFVTNPLFGATNSYSMVIFYGVLWLVLHFIRDDGLPLWVTIFTGALVGFSIALRYSYLPIAIALPVTFVSLGLLRKQGVWYRVAWINLLATGAVVAVTFLYNALSSGLATRTDTLPESQLYLENLRLFYPLGSGTLGVDYGLRYLANLINLDMLPYQLVSWAVSFAVIGIVLWGAWRFLREGFGDLTLSHTTPNAMSNDNLRFFVFVLSGLVHFTLLLLFLTVLSVTNPPEVYSNNLWKYISGDRYYATAMVWLVVMLGFYLSDTNGIRTTLSPYRMRIVHVVLGVIILVGMLGSSLQEVAFWRSRINNWQPFAGSETFILESSDLYSLFYTQKHEENPTLVMWGNTFDRRKIAHLAWLAGASWYDGHFSIHKNMKKTPLWLCGAILLTVAK
jgi:hypothetical protein